jgi:hypothetical protein
MRIEPRIVVLLVVAEVGIGVAVALGGSSSGQPYGIPGMSEEEMDAAGISLVTRGEAEPAISAAEAQAVATEDEEWVLGVVLVNVRRPDRPSPVLAWAVSLDPEKVGHPPPIGIPPGGETFGPTVGVYAVDFIDATTGEWMFSSQKVRPRSGR